MDAAAFCCIKIAASGRRVLKPFFVLRLAVISEKNTIDLHLSP
jgi:hypothetical protein